MTITYEVNATTRQDMGKGASRRLRRLNDQIPGIVYGAGKEAVPLTLNHNEIIHALENEGFYSHILTLKVDGKAEQVVLKDLQRHAYKPKIQHIDFLRVKADEKITMHVPFHFKGEENAPGVKEQDGVFSHLQTEAEITCLPKDLPEFIEIDVSNMTLDETIHLSHIALPKGVALVALEHGNDLGVIAIHMPKAMVEPEPEPEEAEAAEGEKGAEGETTEGTEEGADEGTDTKAPDNA